MITKYPKWSQNIPNGHKISQTITKYPKSSQNIPNGHTISQISVTNSKWPQNISSFSRLRPSKFSPNLEFWFEKRPSGNPGEEGCQHFRTNRQATSALFQRGEKKVFDSFDRSDHLVHKPVILKQGCQMVYFQTKNHKFGTFEKALVWKIVAYFTSIRYDLVYVMAI
jgi:hypothetical protein